MKKILFPSILLIFIFSSCSKNVITSPPDQVSKSGGVLLKIDKENAPSGITEVIAYLSKAESDPLSASMNLLSENSADILFDEVETGLWHLKIDALNSDGVVKYTGETNVEVIEGTTVQINLTLQPTGNGTGSIYITVNWGTGAEWVDYSGNPIFTAEDTPNNPIGGVSEGKVIFHQNKFKMWYLNTHSGGKGNIGYAESSDGINWTVINPLVLEVGSPESWDNTVVAPGSVIIEDGIYKMFYEGANENDITKIGLAFSNDGIIWSKYERPLLETNIKEEHLSVPSVVKKDSIYYLYYHYHNLGEINSKIALALSADGINWHRYSNNPLFEISLEWEKYGVAHPSVALRNDKFEMVYFTTDRKYFGYATSENGKNWTKKLNPIHESNSESVINYPSLQILNNEYRIYYTRSGQYKNNIHLLKKKLN